MAEYCDDGRFAIRRTIWVLQNQYRAVVGKQLGWGGALNGYIENACRSQYGCSAILCSLGQVDQVKMAGYTTNNIIVGFSDFSYQSVFDQAIAKGVSQFYLDEPVLKNKLALLTEASAYAYSKLVRVLTSESDGQEEWIGGSRVKTLANHVLGMVATHRPFVGCHTYFDQGEVLGADPRVQWDWLRNQLGSLFNFAWIRLRAEQSYEEIGLLFGHARNMGGIYKFLMGFWAGEPGWPSDPDKRVDLAADQA